MAPKGVSKQAGSIPAADQHYDRVTRAWRYLLGADFHYGYFRSDDESLAQATTNLTAKLATDADIRAGQSVLDVGCGVGGPAVWLATHIGCHVVGITTSIEGVRGAEALAAEHGVEDHVRFNVADGLDSQLPDDSFDRVWVMESSHLMRDKGRLLRECARVLRPGGRLALCDIVLRKPVELVDLIECRNEWLLLERVFGEAKMELLETYRELAEHACLRLDAIEDISRPTLPTLDRWRKNAERWRHEVQALIGDEALDDFVASCAVLERFWDEGRLGYGMMTATRR